MNSCRRRMRKIVCRICAAALLGAAAGVPAQTAHAQVDAPRNTQPIYSLMSAREAATVDANEAGRRLAQARLKREQGAQPLPGELARGADADVVNHRYWQRQEKLRTVVEQAQLRYNETRRLQLAHR